MSRVQVPWTVPFSTALAPMTGPSRSLRELLMLAFCAAMLAPAGSASRQANNFFVQEFFVQESPGIAGKGMPFVKISEYS